jgi:hypothetical protein
MFGRAQNEMERRGMRERTIKKQKKEVAENTGNLLE